jgi:hypothetical protein
MPYYLVRHKVQDYAKWKPLFDQHGAIRQVYDHRGDSSFAMQMTTMNSSYCGRSVIWKRLVSFFSRRIYDRRCNGLEWRTSLTFTSWN